MSGLSENRPFRIRSMARADLHKVYDWSIAEGWNIGKYDHDVFYAADPNGFFVGELGDEPIGAVSGVAYGQHFGFIGMYIVRPEYRGMGYGLPIFETAMTYLGDRCVGLDGVIAQQDNYKRSGFRFAHRNIRYQWVPPADLPVAGDLAPAASVPFDILAQYDARHFPARRDTFLGAWIREPDSTALVGGTGGSSGGGITAFGMIRRFHHGYCIGPLFADTEDLAQSVLHALCAKHTGEQVFLDAPESNANAIKLAERHGMTPVFETARMYTGTAPDLPLDTIYGITSFELG